MYLLTVLGILLPFFGTSFGSAAVFLSRKTAKTHLLSGFAAGVMMAASVWSLIIPAVEMSSFLELFSFFPMLCGLWLGAFFLLVSERILRHADKNILFILAVVLHNIPEGMAVGVAFTVALAQKSPPLLLSALMLSFGMTMQNIPEGAIISLPLASRGAKQSIAFVYGTLSGIAEPVFAIFTLAFSSVCTVVLPYLLGFAAGAMIYVSAKELIPEANGTEGCISFLVGFSIMMVLDIALG